MQALLHSLPSTLQQATTYPHLCERLLDAHGQFWVSLLWGHCFFLLGPGTHKILFVCTSKEVPPRVLQESVSPVLCKFWRLFGGVNGDLLQEVLCYAHVYCTQSPCHRSSPLLTCTSSGDTQAQFCLSLYGVSGSWCTQGMFEPSAAAPKSLQSCPTL